MCLSIAKYILLFASARRSEISSREVLILAKKTGMDMINSGSYVKKVLGALSDHSKDFSRFLILLKLQSHYLLQRRIF